LGQEIGRANAIEEELSQQLIKASQTLELRKFLAQSKLSGESKETKKKGAQSFGICISGQPTGEKTWPKACIDQEDCCKV